MQHMGYITIPGPDGLPNNVQFWTNTGFIYCLSDSEISEESRWHVEKLLNIEFTLGYRGTLNVERDRCGKYLTYWMYLDCA